MSQGALLLTLIALTLQAPCLDTTCLDEAPLQATSLEAPPLVPIDPQRGPLGATPLLHAPLLDLPLVSPLLDTSLPSTTTPLHPQPSTHTTTPTLDPRPPQAAPTPPDPIPTDAPSSTPLVIGEVAPSEHAPRSQTTNIQGAPLDETDVAHAVATALATLVLIGLYHRLTKKTALKHATRQRILSLLEDTGGGLTTTQLAKRLNVTYRTARHHATKLETFGLACRINKDGPEAWALPSQAPNAKTPLPRPLKRVLKTLLREQSLHLSAIARRLDIAKATAKHRLDRLLDQGLIEDEHIGPLRCFTVTPEGQERCRP